MFKLLVVFSEQFTCIIFIHQMSINLFIYRISEVVLFLFVPGMISCFYFSLTNVCSFCYACLLMNYISKFISPIFILRLFTDYCLFFTNYYSLIQIIKKSLAQIFTYLLGYKMLLIAVNALCVM